MDYDARKDSLLSEQESEKVEIYLSAKNIPASMVVAEVFLQEGNKPRKSVFYSKPTNVIHNKAEFANSIVLEYFFECNYFMIQIDKNYSSNFSKPQATPNSLSAEYKLLSVKYSMAEKKGSLRTSTLMEKNMEIYTWDAKKLKEDPKNMSNLTSSPVT